VSTIDTLTDPLIPACCHVPVAGAGVCSICHSASDDAGDVCTSCARTMGEVSRPTRLVIPLSLYTTPNQLWRVLRYYKDVPADATPAAFRPTQAQFQWQVAALLARFTREHARCIAAVADGDWDAVTSVPSGRARPGDHPLEQAIQRVPWLRDKYVRLLRRTAVSVPARRAHDHKYGVIRKVEGCRVLLIDDTFTSGSSAQSAGSALRRAGARVTATLVIGRVIRPERNRATLRHWIRARRKKFRFDVCCVGNHRE